MVIAITMILLYLVQQVDLTYCARYNLSLVLKMIYSSNSAVTINPRGVCSIFLMIPLVDLILSEFG